VSKGIFIARENQYGVVSPHHRAIAASYEGFLMRRSIILTLLLTLSACATPEQRLQAGLEGAGLSHPMSACMAAKMIHQLSLGELQKLSSLGGLKERPIGEMSIEELMHRVRALNDSHIVTVTARAGLSCAIDPSR
jgi:hypothetical protein